MRKKDREEQSRSKIKVWLREEAFFYTQEIRERRCRRAAKKRNEDAAELREKDYQQLLVYAQEASLKLWKLISKEQIWPLIELLDQKINQKNEAEQRARSCGCTSCWKRYELLQLECNRLLQIATGKYVIPDEDAYNDPLTIEELISKLS